MDKESIEKMKAWHAGTRKQNYKACSDEKLEKYYKICLDLGYAIQANILYGESVERGLEFDHIEFTCTPDLPEDQICTYIEQHYNSIGDSGYDLFKSYIWDKICYGWAEDIKGFVSEDMADCIVDIPHHTISFGDLVISTKDTSAVVKAIDDELFNC